MTYEDYLVSRKNSVKKSINDILINIRDVESATEVLDEVLLNYERIMTEKVVDLYSKVGLKPERYQLETMISRVNDESVKASIRQIYFELEILHESIGELTGKYDDYEREPVTLDEALSLIPDDKVMEVKKMIQKYVDMYRCEPVYIGRGESCIVFQIGDKVIKFGSMRKYLNIPYCLDIHDSIQFDKYQHVYVTDKIETFEVSEEICQKMYNALRERGYVWVDVKPDNIGMQNGQLKILDDVDIFSLADALEYGKSSVLDFVSNNMRVALLELNWLKTKIPSFNLSFVDKLFDNQSPHTLDFIDRLKFEYLKSVGNYDFDPEQNYYVLFCEMLRKKIEQINMDDAFCSSKKSI